MLTLKTNIDTIYTNETSNEKEKKIYILHDGKHIFRAKLVEVPDNRWVQNVYAIMEKMAHLLCY